MTIEKRLELVRQLGAASFRPNAIFVESWAGASEECDAAQRAGLKVILTVRNKGSGGQASTPPQDLSRFAETVGSILDRCRPSLLVVENEENSDLFYQGSPAEYGEELKTACDAAHSRGIPCTDGGMVSLLAASLGYDHYLEIGADSSAEEFSQRVFSPDEQNRLDSQAAREQIERGKALLAVIPASGADYINFHWYIEDPKALEETVDFLQDQIRLPVITNEIGQHEIDPAVVTALMGKVLELGLSNAVWYSIDGPKAKALMNEDGSLRENGMAFQLFIWETYEVISMS